MVAQGAGHDAGAGGGLQHGGGLAGGGAARNVGRIVDENDFSAAGASDASWQACNPSQDGNGWDIARIAVSGPTQTSWPDTVRNNVPPFPPGACTVTAIVVPLSGYRRTSCIATWKSKRVDGSVYA